MSEDNNKTTKIVLPKIAPKGSRNPFSTSVNIGADNAKSSLLKGNRSGFGGGSKIIRKAPSGSK